MSTRCGIVEKLNNGDFKLTSSHWDGGYEYNGSTGWTLNKYYSRPTKVNNLINLGQLSIVGRYLTPSPELHKYGFSLEKMYGSGLSDKQRDNVMAIDHQHTHAYHRDRKEPKYGPWTFHNFTDLKHFIAKEFGYSFEYIYLYQNQQWHLLFKYGYKKQLPTLHSLINKIVRYQHSKQRKINEHRPHVYAKLAKFLNSYLVSLSLNNVQVQRGFKNIYTKEALETIITNVYKYLHQNCKNYLLDKIIDKLDMACEHYDFFEVKEFGEIMTKHKRINLKSVTNDLSQVTKALNHSFATTKYL